MQIVYDEIMPRPMSMRFENVRVIIGQIVMRMYDGVGVTCWPKPQRGNGPNARNDRKQYERCGLPNVCANLTSERVAD